MDTVRTRTLPSPRPELGSGAARLLPALLVTIALGCMGSGEPRNPAIEDGGRKILRVARRAEYKSLDPAGQFDSASAQIVGNIYDTLLEYHYLQRPYELVPNLLAEMPQLSEDGTTYLLTLRRGVRFHDDPAFPGGVGRELTIDDVIYSIKRFADVNVNVKSYILIQNVIVGLDAFRDATRQHGPGMDYDAHDVEGLQRDGDYRLKLRLTRENPLALYPLAATPMSIVAREVVEAYGEDFARHPVGTGPFTMHRNDRRGRVVLAKYPRYHGRYPDRGMAGDRERGFLEDAGARLPLVDEVHLPLIEESQPAMLRFRKGELDLHTVDRDNFIKMVDRKDGEFRLRSPYAEQFELITAESLATEYIAFNMNDPLVGENVALRQAIAYALDVEEYIEIMLNGRAAPLKTVVPLPIAGSQRDIGADYYEHNPERAKQKLVEAGFPGGEGLPAIRFDYRSTTKETRQGFEFMRYKLAAVGIKAIGRFHTFSAYLQRIESGNFQVGSSGWYADYPDAENFYQLLFGKNGPPGPNISAFADPEYDRLYLQSRFMTNGPARFAIFERMSEILRDRVPVILRYNSISFAIYQKRLENFSANMMVDAPFKYVDLDIRLAADEGVESEREAADER